jgi:hypothetical protein
MTCGNGWPGYRPAIPRHPATGTGHLALNPVPVRAVTRQASSPNPVPVRAVTRQVSSPNPVPTRAPIPRRGQMMPTSRTGPARTATRAGRIRAARTRAVGQPLSGQAGMAGRVAPPLGTCRLFAVTGRTGRGSPASRPSRGSAMIPLAVRTERGLAGLLAGK